MASRRQRVLEALKARLAAIVIADGFQTDAGQHVTLGEHQELGPDDPPAVLAMVVGDEAPAPPGQRLKVLYQLPVEIQVLAKADLDEPWVAVEAALADVKTAVELEDRTVGGFAQTIERGPVRTLPREPGTTTVGAGVIYLLTMQEGWGTP